MERPTPLLLSVFTSTATKKHPQLPPALISMNQLRMGPWHARHPPPPQPSHLPTRTPPHPHPNWATHSTLSQRRLSVVSRSRCAAETLRCVCFAEL